MEVKQAQDVVIEVSPLLDGAVPAQLTHANYVIYNKKNVVVLTKDLSSGVSYNDGKLTVFLSEVETAAFLGSYTQECVARTGDGVDFFPLSARPITFIKTNARIA
jgi:hypothetical protein